MERTTFVRNMIRRFAFQVKAQAQVELEEADGVAGVV